MPRIFYVHWDKDEAMHTVHQMRDAGHTVVAHYSTEDGAGEDAWKKIKTNPPDALVISLERLPSHGRRIAAVTMEVKKLRDLPIIFVDGERDKVDIARGEFPRAKCISSDSLLDVLRRLNKPVNPRSAPPRHGRETRIIRRPALK